MATKSNIRSMRFSDEILAMIEEQPGETFTAKFEWLVKRCATELQKKQTELEHLEEKIHEKREELRYLSDKAMTYGAALGQMQWDMNKLRRAIERTAKEDNS